MGRGDWLGEFEQLVLLALIRLGDGEGYGLAVRREIEARAGRTAAIGAVYATLDRLEEKGLVSSTLGEPTAERGGRGKRLFRVTAAGQKKLRESQQALAGMLEGLPGSWRRA